MTAKKPAGRPDGKATRWLRASGTLGLLLSVAAFALYVAGVLQTDVPPEASAELWRLPADEYREAAGLDSGAGWMFASADGYAASTAALAVLASAALPTLAVLTVAWFRRKNVLYGVMALAIAAILVLAIIG
jgi:hypothetical protein